MTAQAYQEICGALKQRRRSLKLRQIDVAEAAGYSEWQVGRWESGKTMPRTRTLLDWCGALGVKLQVAER